MVKTISVSETTHNALQEIGKKGDTFDSIIMELVSWYKTKDSDSDQK